MIRSPLVDSVADLHPKEMGVGGSEKMDFGEKRARGAGLGMSASWPAGVPLSPPCATSPTRGDWQSRFASPAALVDDAAGLRCVSGPNWHGQPGFLPSASQVRASVSLASALPATASHLHITQGLQALPPIYSPFFDQMECRDANSSAAAAAVLGWPYSQLYYASYDPLIGQVGGYPNDLTGTRRKNATRETTSTLKAWLKEHKKNPYPTKSEKIMLAIISKMTLTQVSTWFANARRRLKKENKMMWDPNNRRSDDVEVDDSDSDDQTQSKPTPTKCHQRDSIANDTSSTRLGNTSVEQKPKIWSIVDTASAGPPEAAVVSRAPKRPLDVDVDVDVDADDDGSPRRKARADLPASESGSSARDTASTSQNPDSL